MSNPRSLDPFFAPESVAVVGASTRASSVGYAVFRNLLFGGKHSDDRDRGFHGEVWGVNPKGGELLGEPLYASLTALPAAPDLVVVAIPPQFIPGTLTEAAGLGTRAMIVISAGFAELGAEGKALQDALARQAAELGVRLIGPNCLGVIRPSLQLNASFAAASPAPGRIGLLSQSGALVTGLISCCERERFGLSAAVSLGAKADVEDEDVLRWLADDDETGCLAIYMEALTDPAGFISAALAISPSKPIVAIKGGTTAAGAQAASSHTGSLAGSVAAYRAAFAQTGVLEATTVGEFLAWARALAYQPPAPGERVAILTNAGGPGVLAADAATRRGLTLAELAPATRERLDAVLPSVWSHGNPVDVIGDADSERYGRALEILFEAPEVDAIVLIMTEQAMTDPLETAAAIAEVHERLGGTKPLVASFIGLDGTPVGAYLDERGVPEISLPELAVAAIDGSVRRGRWLRRTPAPPPSLDLPAPNLGAARAHLDAARAAGQTNLDLALAREVLAACGLPYNYSGTATDANEAAKVAAEMGFPVVVKLISPDVVHKSDVGGVVLDVIDADGVRAACAKIRQRVAEHDPEARITGFTIEEQIKGTEVIVGMSRDPSFGPLLMVGMGGIFVEVYKDVAFRLLPLTRRDALDVIDEVRAQALFDGARNQPVLNRDELAEVLLRVSALVEAYPEIRELDVNPLVITRRGLVAIDARVVIGEGEPAHA
ncbi:MAG: acetate--CoA ligase family protein [Planctomycetes bacterium]|nr:acetate--CoA ligase family protein [Planctomycetota bacterium]